ncbi:YidC/Oxa1 family membrane protein insertase [Maritalea mobilis]|uniref:Membrane protein insertase YidC n=1 Tax=Maritalea mobilis TaxID=483324 RepID=A0A4R6VPQ1_9HYPH|nr:membrane protein insertase YidC [Maritalea mobilis]TDQ64252.1 YidC/Oxa1 family membrane protein insertase [Maritalea mobilis]
MNEGRNYVLAIGLSILVLVGWQFFVAGPQLERAQRQAEIAAQQEQSQSDVSDLPTPSADGSTADVATQTTGIVGSREDVIAQGDRVTIETVALTGSINLTGGRIDDLRLKRYHETVDDSSPIITLLSPEGTPEPYFVEQGWVSSTGSTTNLPKADTKWQVEGNDTLAVNTPVTLTFDNGAGQVFTRTFNVDENYLFTVTQSVQNNGTGDIALFPYSRVTRQETPQTSGFFILHEGPLGVLSDNNLVELSYKDLAEEGRKDYSANGGWLGFTDKYWAAAVVPKPETAINARFSYRTANGRPTYQSSYVAQDPVVIGPEQTGSFESYVFAGAKVEKYIDNYEQNLGIDRFELLIDWGWFHFITKPIFYLIRMLYGILGNFGLAILAVTVLIKAAFFWFANKSYASMAAMKKVQPEMKEIQERFKDDRMQQQQAMMELYKREKINPMSGCWPVLIQIPVFFSLYKVLFVTIEMRHAPFFGWIQDLASPDPTNVFNLFGLLPFDPTGLPLLGGFLALGAWPLIMGITMFVQMRLNPPPTDATQAAIFAWMPVIFTFMLAGFPAGLVIYWAWNNFLSILQQYVIMRRHGVDVDLLGNIKSTFKRKKPVEEKEAK